MSTPQRLGTLLAVLALIGAISQVLAPAVPFSGLGARPNESTVDLLITPAGYTFSIWSVIYLLSLVLAVVVLIKRTTGTAQPARVLAELTVAFFGAAVWILFSAAEWTWLTSIVLTIMAVVLLDAARIAASATDTGPSWVTALTRTTVGIYAGWATAAVFQNWASDAAKTGADANALGWQLVVLIVAAATATVVTWFVGAPLIGYPLTVIWALIGIVVTAAGQTTAVVVVCVVSIAVLALAAAARMLRAPRFARHQSVPAAPIESAGTD